MPKRSYANGDLIHLTNSRHRFICSNKIHFLPMIQSIRIVAHSKYIFARPKHIKRTNEANNCAQQVCRLRRMVLSGDAPLDGHLLRLDIPLRPPHTSGCLQFRLLAVHQFHESNLQHSFYHHLLLKCVLNAVLLNRILFN